MLCPPPPRRQAGKEVRGRGGVNRRARASIPSFFSQSDNDNTAFIVLTVVCGFVGVLVRACVTGGRREGAVLDRSPPPSSIKTNHTASPSPQLVANVALWYAAQKTAGDRKGKKVVSKKKARREAMMRGFTVPGD